MTPAKSLLYVLETLKEAYVGVAVSVKVDLNNFGNFEDNNLSYSIYVASTEDGSYLHKTFETIKETVEYVEGL